MVVRSHKPQILLKLERNVIEKPDLPHFKIIRFSRINGIIQEHSRIQRINLLIRSVRSVATGRRARRWGHVPPHPPPPIIYFGRKGFTYWLQSAEIKCFSLTKKWATENLILFILRLKIN